MDRKLAIVLASGGLDSAVTTAIAKQDCDVAMLHMNYGQQTERRELQSFNRLAEFYQAVDTLVVNVEHLAQIGGSSLTDAKKKVRRADLESQDIPNSYVPFRNANILAVATSWAEVIGATRLFVGAVEEDSSGYPDCRRVFYDAFENAIDAGTKPETRIKIITPIIEMGKTAIVLKGAELNVPFELTWSCYQREEKACGICDSCALRLRGFQQAGVEDPLEYLERPVY